MREIMKRAHEIARKMEGDYRARMSLALRQAWEEERMGNNRMTEIIKKYKLWIDNNGKIWGRTVDTQTASYLKENMAELKKELTRMRDERVAMAMGEVKEALKKEEEKQAKRDALRKEQEEQKLEEAKKAGKPVIIRTLSAPCNDPNEDCDLDNIIVYAMPDGTIKTERHHTW